MATEAQIQANRSNAEKSTGPRTPEGKEKASQNSLKHREMLLEQLDPVGPLEGILAARIVDLSWRLGRAAQNQNEAFGALYDRHTAEAGEPQGPQQRGTLLGRMILEDFEQDAILERLQRYERRIESSFYRTLKELRHVHDQIRKADQEVAGTLQRWREEDMEARKARAFACAPPWGGSPAPAGGTTNTPGTEVAHPSKIPSAPFTHPVADPLPESETCKTNPISAGVSSWKCEVSGETCKTNPIAKYQVSSVKFEVSDQKEHVPGALTSNFTLDTSNSPPAAPVGGVACKTNPISPGAAPSGEPAGLYG
jgi:hypothetical protein